MFVLKKRLPLMVVLGICSITFLSRCVTLSKDQIAKGSTDYNKVVEKAQNEMLLLNIVRASKRSPMYFTDFNAMRGNLTLNIQTGSINIPFGSVGTGYNGSYSIAPSASFTTNPNFDLIVNDSQEFTRGLMTPVSMETLNYYWEQGWQQELLLTLFIRRIEEIDRDGKVKKEEKDGKMVKLAYNNYPEKTNELNRFQAKLRELFFKNECTIVAEAKTDPIGPQISKDQASDLGNLIELHKAGLELQLSDKKDLYILISKEVTYQFKCFKKKGITVRTDFSLLDKNKLEKCEKNDCVKIYLRSPEAILYYLGEIVRAEIENQSKPPAIQIYGCQPDPEKPGEATLFLVDKSTDNKIPAVIVDYDGDKYVISRSSAGTDSCLIDRSMHVLTLISQLIGLQKKGEKTPVTGVVTITGAK